MPLIHAKCGGTLTVTSRYKGLVIRCGKCQDVRVVPRAKSKRDDPKPGWVSFPVPSTWR